MATTRLVALWRWVCAWWKTPARPTGPRPRILTLASFKARARHHHDSDWYKKQILNDPCVYCGSVSTGRDHIVPRSKGGADGWENRAPACRSCDGQKANETMLAFLLMRRRGQVRIKRQQVATQSTRARRAQRANQRRIVRAWLRAQPSWKLGDIVRIVPARRGKSECPSSPLVT